MAITLDYIVEARQLRQLLGPSAGNRGLTDFGIVANYSCPASRKTNIKLEAVATMLDCKIERGESILRNPGRRTCPAMAEKEGGRGHCAF
jgi:hypothetical protein